jgi:UDP-N-acetylmuramate--alanine ligase
LPFYGLAVVCGDDPGVKRCLGRFRKPYLTYGLNEGRDFRAVDVQLLPQGSIFTVVRKRHPQGLATEGFEEVLGRIQLSVPGQHNVLNALAAVVVGWHLDLPFEKIARGLESFRGVKRRFELRWNSPETRQAILDDYGHHPTEIVATLEAARLYWPEGRIVSVFQPHRYSRTLHCREGFRSAFAKSDVLLVMDIYAAGEEPIEGVSGAGLTQEIQKFAPSHQKVVYSGDFESTCRQLKALFSPGDLILCLGAGSITQLPDRLLTAMRGP